MVKNESGLGQQRLQHFQRVIAEPGVTVKLDVTACGKTGLNEEKGPDKPGYAQAGSQSGQTPTSLRQPLIQPQHGDNQGHILFTSHGQKRKKDEVEVVFLFKRQKSKK